MLTNDSLSDGVIRHRLTAVRCYGLPDGVTRRHLTAVRGFPQSINPPLMGVSLGLIVGLLPLGPLLFPPATAVTKNFSAALPSGYVPSHNCVLNCFLWFLFLMSAFCSAFLDTRFQTTTTGKMNDCDATTLTLCMSTMHTMVCTLGAGSGGEAQHCWEAFALPWTSWRRWVRIFEPKRQLSLLTRYHAILSYHI